MAPSKIDTLIASLSDFNKTIGGFSSDIRTLYRRAAEDRDERKREHNENQARMGEIAQSTATSISELRQAATKRWDETGQAVERLSEETKELARKIDDQTRALAEHATTVSQQQKTIAGLQIGRGKLVFLASVGMFALTAVGWAAQEGIKWVFAFALKKIGVGP
jgi:hypothetical protein